MEHPNVILICVDQWRGDALSIEGHPVVRTPYLDGFSLDGLRARRAYSASPTCIPARMTLMTGLSASTHGRVGYADGVPFDSRTTLPGEFRKAGYQTRAIGKMHYSPERVHIGFDDVLLHDGYLHYSRARDRDPAWHDDYLTWLRDQKETRAVDDYIDNGINCNSVVARPWDKAERLHPTNWVVSEGIRWLYRRDPTVPFFLYLSFHRPHAPFDPPAWAFEQYLAKAQHSEPMGDWLEIIEEYRNDYRPDAHVAHYPADVRRRAQAGYYGHLSHIDQQIQRFLDVLGEFGLAQDAVVCFTSDHGDMLGDHGMWRKGYPYEGSARVPFLVRGPMIPAGSVVDELIELRDVMPTLLDSAGLDVPGHVEGRSVLSLLGASADAGDSEASASSVSSGASGQRIAKRCWRKNLHGEHFIFGQSLQWIWTQRYLYVWWSKVGREQLFDYVADPEQHHDLVSAEGMRVARHDQVLNECRALLMDALADREEGFVAGHGSARRLVPGRRASPVLSHAGADPVSVPHPAPVWDVPDR